MSPSKRERLKQEKRRRKWQQEQDLRSGQLRFDAWVRDTILRQPAPKFLFGSDRSALIWPDEPEPQAEPAAKAFNDFVQNPPSVTIEIDVTPNDAGGMLWRALGGRVDTYQTNSGTFEHRFSGPNPFPDWPDLIDQNQK